jgi:hypothetical protein
VPVYIAVPYTLVPSNSVWKYLDNGTDQGTAWQLINFDDSGWGEGMADIRLWEIVQIHQADQKIQFSATD